MAKEIAETIISADEIAARVDELAREIAMDFSGNPLSVIMIANGSIFFGVDLLRRIPHALQLDILAVSSYIGRQSSGKIQVRSELKIDIRDRHVLVIDDIFDTGRTLRHVVNELETRCPKEVRTCVLLEKSRPRQEFGKPDYTGFHIDDKFVVGYGLDYNERYRNLPYIGVLGDDIGPEPEALQGD